MQSQLMRHSICSTAKKKTFSYGHYDNDHNNDDDDKPTAIWNTHIFHSHTKYNGTDVPK